VNFFLENFLVEFRFTHPRHSKSLQSYPAMYVRLKTARVWTGYLTTFAITLCMFALGLGSFALSLDESNLGNRLQYCVVFLLADVGTLQLMFEKLPKIQYTTFMEEYTFSCFLFLFAITIWACIAGAFPRIGDYDGVAFQVFLHIFWSFQVISIVRARYSRHWERQKLDKSTSQLKRFIERNICCNMCCMRREQKKLIVATWDHQRFLKKEQARIKGQPGLVVAGQVIPDEKSENRPAGHI